jgi:hypothetical protein
VLRFPSLDCLVYFDPGRGRRERCPEDGLDLDDRKPGSNHTFGNR